MKVLQCFAALLVCLIIVVAGCSKKTAPQPVSLVIEADPAVKALLEQIIKDDPLAILEDTETKYSIQVVKPDPAVDYMIAKVIPKSSVDYKIIIVNPLSGKKVTGLSDFLENALREKLHQKQKGSTGDESLDVFMKP